MFVQETQIITRIKDYYFTYKDEFFFFFPFSKKIN